MYSVIIVAGGTGNRMCSHAPKQFLLLRNKPIIVHCIEKFIGFAPGIQVIVSIHPQLKDEMIGIREKYHLPGIIITEGGETRFHSVESGLAALAEQTRLVAVHDAARPLVSLETIKHTFAAAEKYGAAIPVIEMNESLREIKQVGSMAVDRKKFKVVQTPQCFKKEILVGAYRQKYSPVFTDDASVVEAGGNFIQLSQGNIQNIKITYPHDIQLAEYLFDK